MRTKTTQTTVCSLRFEAVEVDDLFAVLGAVAWLNCPDVKQISQFAELDLKTTRQLVKNGIVLRLLDSSNGELYSLVPPYPFKGSLAQQRAVVRAALVQMPLLTNVRQFLSMEKTPDKEALDAALRKAAAVQRIEHFDPAELAPLLRWARELKALEPDLAWEDLDEEAAAAKSERNEKHPTKRVVLLSHNSKDNPSIRQIAADLTTAGISVWLHDQRVRMVEGIPEKLAQGIVGADFLLLGLSEAAVESPWVAAEVNAEFLTEVTKRGARLLPLKLTDCSIPEVLVRKGFVDFSASYKLGLQELLATLTAKLEPVVDLAIEPVAGGVLPPGTLVTER